MAASGDLKVGLIGCGAVSEHYHLPALQRLLPPGRIWLADSDPERSRLLGERLGAAGRTVTDHRELLDVIDAAIVAVPNDLHAPVASELLARGIHVLCEKPLASTFEEAKSIVAATGPGTILRVGNVRRFFPSTRFLGHIVRQELYGRPVSFTAEDGILFEWPASSGFFLDRKRSGGGVLIDAGAHVLDQLRFWFGEDLEIRSYEDNGYGGVETDCRIEIATGSVMGTVELSRIRRLSNTIRVECEGGTAEVPLSELAETIRVTSSDSGGYTLEAGLEDESVDAHVAEVDDFLKQVRGELGIGATGEDGLAVLRLIRDCYSRRKSLDEPWVSKTLHRRAEQGQGEPLSSLYRKILVTGASGFLGTRLCEQLHLGHGVPVRGMIHTYGRAIRLARLEIELVEADLADPSSLARAVEGCDAVVHCAIASGGPPDEYRFLTGRATRGVAEAALRVGVKRFVHISSVGVYGYNPPEKDIDEQTPSRYTGDIYCDGKLDAEREVLTAIGKGLPAVILRPTNIFGPHSTIFTVEPVEALKAQYVALAGDGSGPANTVYVDNVVHAIVLALQSEAAVGECFIVSDEDGTTWKDLYEAYAAVISPDCRVRSIPMEVLYPEPSPPPEESLISRGSLPARLRRRVVKQPLLRAVGRTAFAPFPGAKRRLIGWFLPTSGAAAPKPEPESPEPSPPEAIEEFSRDEIPSKGFAEIQTSGARFRAHKLRSVLGYVPAVRFDHAIELTGEWLRFNRAI